jgi:protein arginine N-methyltransferase 2
MKDMGWYDKPGVKILEGKWQDFINPAKIGTVVPDGGFDVVYTDSFSEDYQALRQFFGHLQVLLGPRSRFSFFNGLGATSKLCALPVESYGSLR